MIGDELKARRAKLELSQTKLAKRLGVTSTTVARWERDESPIPFHLKMTMEYLALQIEAERASKTNEEKHEHNVAHRRRKNGVTK